MPVVCFYFINKSRGSFPLHPTKKKEAGKKQMKWDFFFLQNIGLVTRFHNRFSFFYHQSNLAVIDKFFAFNSPKQKEQ